MGFKMKYEIITDYLPKPSYRRPGHLISKVGFIVAHDTGNKGSTARNNVTYFKNSANDIKASAHIFVDDKEIIECIPALKGTPEKAWHVLYDRPLDNQLYGDDANDIAIGVELCYGPKINADEAYKRYIWVMAYICYKFGLDPAKAIIGHHKLDPGRKTDPQNALSQMGRSYDQLLIDVVKEYKECIGGTDMIPTWKQTIMNKAIAAGLIEKDKHHPDEVGNKWFMLAVALNVLDKVFAELNSLKNEVAKLKKGV